MASDVTKWPGGPLSCAGNNLTADWTVMILGSGGFARELMVYCQTTLPGIRIYLVDNTATNQFDIIPEEYYYEICQSEYRASIIGSGSQKIKARMVTQISGPIATFVHPRAIILSDDIGQGSVIAPGAVVAPHTSIGQHVLVNYNATIGHNANIGDLAVVGPNASVGGFCKIERGAYIGSGANIREHLTIGAGAIVGMGAVVVNDVPPGVVAKGVPAKW